MITVNRFFLCALACCLIIPLSANAMLQSAKDIPVIKQQLRAYLWESLEQDDAGLTSQWMKSLQPDGTWKDIIYPTQGVSDWNLLEHLIRLDIMCRDYSCPESKFHSNPALGKAIHSAFDYWLQKDYRSANWQRDEVGVPERIGHILILLDQEVTPIELEQGLKILYRGSIKLTGQNRVWLSGVTLIRALFLKDIYLAIEAKTNIENEIQITSKEGLQQDFSFHQHESQLYIGGYGLAYAQSMVQWVRAFKGTILAFPDEKVTLVREYLLKGVAAVTWKGCIDTNSIGRDIYPNALSPAYPPRSPIDRGRLANRIMEIMKKGDPSHVTEYQAAMDSICGDGQKPSLLDGNHYFWCSDYMVHRRPAYYISTKMNSTRIFPTESINGDNLQGNYLGDGATYLYQSGKEYEDIFPVWDWRRLPGVTCQQSSAKLVLKPIFQSQNPSDFVGGVSDGRFGAATLDLTRDGVTCKKSWFYFDDQIVCLGSGISCNTDLPVMTTINQCLKKGAAIVCDEKGENPPAPGLQKYDNVKWAWHDKVGYLFLEPSKATLGVQQQTGSWKDVYADGSPTPITREVFSIGIEHGAKPHGDQYSYLLCPNVTLGELKLMATKPEIKILTNTRTLQAVRHEGLKVTQAVFFQPGDLEDGPNKIHVDQPCLLLVQDTEHGLNLTVSDPTQKLKEIRLTLNDSPHVFTLPSGLEAGRSITQEGK